MRLSERPYDEEVARRLVQDSRSLGRPLGRLGARLAASRGVTPQGLRDHLFPRISQIRDPRLIPNFTTAVERIATAVKAGERIAIFGDYDVDGTTSASIVHLFLTSLGCQPTATIARRGDGYGFVETAARRTLESKPALVIVLDCGTGNEREIEICRQSGADVVVLDHHTVPNDVSRHPAILVNPWVPDCEYPHRSFATAGLAWLAVTCVAKALNSRIPFDLLDLAALGTVCDVMPLINENRAIVAAGIKRLGSRTGIAELISLANHSGSVDEMTAGWKIGPRINAAGRVGDARRAFELLTATNPEEAARAAEQLEQLNELRRALQDEDEAAALSKVDTSKRAIVVAGESWCGGTVGIVAARLAERYNRPAFVATLEDGFARGSARRGGGLDVLPLLKAAEHALAGYGGHAAAAGWSSRDFPSAKAAIERAAAEMTVEVPEDGVVEVDALVTTDDLTAVSIRGVDWLRPFGAANEAPVVALAAKVVESKQVGKDGDHAKLVLSEGGREIDAIQFRAQGPEVGSHVTAIGTPQLNEWRGRTKPQLLIEALW